MATSRAFAHRVGRLLVSRDPDHLTQEFNKADRGGRILVDTGRNGYSATFAAAYAVRAKPGAPVSAPCTWDEVERGDAGPQTFTLRTMAARIAAVGELWARDARARAVAAKRDGTVEGNAGRKTMNVHLIDGTYELFRHYFAVPSLLATNGLEVGAVRGVLTSVLAIIEGGATHVAVATDHVVESFRNDLYAGYKTSEGVPENLLAQFPCWKKRCNRWV